MAGGGQRQKASVYESRDAARRNIVLSVRAPAVLMPTGDAPQGPLIAGGATRRPHEAASARPRPCDRLCALSRGSRPFSGATRALDLCRDFDKPRPSASARHQPPITPLSRPTLLTGQGLAQAEKPKPACSLAPHSSRASTGEETADRPPSGPPARRRAAAPGLSARLARAAG